MKGVMFQGKNVPVDTASTSSHFWQSSKLPTWNTITSIAANPAAAEYVIAGDTAGNSYVSIDKGSAWIQDTASMNGFEIGAPTSIFAAGAASSAQKFTLLKSSNIYSQTYTTPVTAEWNKESGRNIWESGSAATAFIDISGAKDYYNTQALRGAAADMFLYYRFVTSPTLATTYSQNVWHKTPPFAAPFTITTFTNAITRKCFGAMGATTGLKLLLVGHGRLETTDPYTVFVMVYTWSENTWSKYDIYTAPAGVTTAPAYGLTTSSARAYLTVTISGTTSRLYTTTTGALWTQCAIPGVSETSATDILSGPISGWGNAVAVGMPQGRILYSVNAATFAIYQVPTWIYSTTATATTTFAGVDVSKMYNTTGELVFAYFYTNTVWLTYIDSTSGSVLRTITGALNAAAGTLSNPSQIALCGDNVMMWATKTVWKEGSFTKSTTASSGVYCALYGAINGGFRECYSLSTKAISKITIGASALVLTSSADGLPVNYRGVTTATTVYNSGLLKNADFYTRIAPWTAGVSYNVGDKAVYQQSTYECKTAHTSGISFTIANWTDAYSTAKQYALDDKVKYGTAYISNMIYRCITPMSTAGEFNAYEWEWDEANAVFLTGTTAYIAPPRNAFKTMTTAPMLNLLIFASGNTTASPETTGMYQQAARSLFLAASTNAATGFYRIPVTLPNGGLIMKITSIASFTYTEPKTAAKYPALWISGYSAAPRTTTYQSFLGWMYYASTASTLKMSNWSALTLVSGYNTSIMPASASGGAIDMAADGNSFLIIGGASGYVQATRDMGKTWEEQVRPDGSATAIAEFAFNATVKIIGCVKTLSGGGVSVSIDYGRSWINQNIPTGAGSPTSIAIGSDKTVYIGGTQGQVFVNKYAAQ